MRQSPDTGIRVPVLPCMRFFTVFIVNFNQENTEAFMKTINASSRLLFPAESLGKKVNMSFPQEKKTIRRFSSQNRPKCTTATVIAMFNGTIVNEKTTSFKLEL